MANNATDAKSCLEIDIDLSPFLRRYRCVWEIKEELPAVENQKFAIEDRRNLGLFDAKLQRSLN